MGTEIEVGLPIKASERRIESAAAVIPPPIASAVAIFPGTGAGDGAPMLGAGSNEIAAGVVDKLFGAIRGAADPVQAVGSGPAENRNSPISDMRERSLSERLGDMLGSFRRAIGFGEPEQPQVNAEWNPKVGGAEKSYINETLAGKLVNFKYKHVEANEGRPDVYYCPPEMMKAVVRDMYLNNGAPPEVAKERASFPEAFYTDTNPLKRGGGPAMFIPLPEAGSKEDKINWGSKIHHEHIHWKGGDEGSAWVGTRDYIEKNGGRANFQTIGEIIEHIADNYSPHATQKAFKELYDKTVSSPGETTDLFKTVARLAGNAETYVQFIKASLGGGFDTRAEELTEKFRPGKGEPSGDGEMKMFSGK
jgi:hypothetical protein